jgi:ankyrin repeat protein
VASQLIDGGALVNVADQHGNTPLHVQAHKQRSDVLGVLMREGQAKLSLPNNVGKTVLHVAVDSGSTDMVHNVIKAAQNYNFSADHTCVSSPQDFINAGDTNGRSVLHYAVAKDLPGLASTLIDNGASVNSADVSGNTPIHLAAAKASDATIKAVTDAPGAEINKKNSSGDTALMISGGVGNVAATKELVLKGADTKVTNKAGLSATDIAFGAGDF